jgi:PLP dependent protein
MSTIAANLQAIRRRISEALQGDSRQITVVAVSKQRPVDAIREAFDAGCRDFGENYVQEALPKLAALADAPIVWHFIGHLQTNKARDVAEHFDWVHGIDKVKTAAALARARPEARGELNVCLQVNISAEQTKPHIRLRGLMGMASPTQDVSEQRAQFARLAATRGELNAAGLALDTLSMGMTQDFEAALAEGATMVRIGTAIFGERSRKEAA